MDHVSANKTLSITERENISGVRVLDGEDQGKKIKTKNLNLTFKNNFHLNCT